MSLKHLSKRLYLPIKLEFRFIRNYQAGDFKTQYMTKSTLHGAKMDS